MRKRNKKINLVFFHPYSSIGGADKSLSRLINGLDEKDYNIFFLTLKKPYIQNYLKRKIKIIKLNKSKTILSIFEIRKFLRNLNKNEKIIFFSNQNFANIISFFILLGFKNVKQILMERNHVDEFNYSNNFYDYLKKRIIIFLMKLLYKKADLVIGNAKKLSLDLKKLTGCKVQTIYNPALDYQIYKFSKKKIKKINKKNIILNIGRLELQKDQITLLQAIKNISNIYLIIIGYGKEKNYLKKYIKENNLNKKVLILDKIANPYPYYRISELFISTSLYEGFPNVLTEAIMFDVPVISSNCNSGPAEILLQNKGIQIFEKRNHFELEKKIKFFLKNKNLFKKRGKFLKRQLNRFNQEKIVSQFDKIFKNIN